MLGRGRAEVSEPLLRSAYSLGANSVLTAGLGMAFWIAAARLYPSGSVGRDSALIAGMVQISTVAQVNMANALIRFMPANAAPGRLLVGAYAISAAAAIVLGIGFVLVAPHVTKNFGFLAREPLIAVAYVAAVVLWGVFSLQDAALTAMGQAPWVPLENGVFGLLKLAGLPLLFAIGSAHGVFIAWAVPMVVLLFPVNWLLFGRILSRRREAPANTFSPFPFGRRRLARFLAFDYVGTVFMQTSLALLPLMVVVVLGSPANAHFYIPFTIAIAIDSTFISIATSLVAEGARTPDRIPVLVRLLVRRLALVAVPGIAFLVIAAPLVMLLFGHEYVRASTAVLRILVCASLFRAVMALVAAIWRLEGRSGLIATLEGCLLVTALAAAIPLAQELGIIGVALAWLGATIVTGCAVAPVLIRWFRAGGEAAPAEPAQVVEANR